MSIELMRQISQLRRDMSRNATVMNVCDELESRLKASPPVIAPSDAKPTQVAIRKSPDCPACKKRNERQRDLMRKRRANEKANG